MTLRKIHKDMIDESLLNGVNERIDQLRIETEQNKYVHPENHPASIIMQDANNRFVTDLEKTAWNEGIKAKIATQTEIGNVKVGKGLSITSGGELSVSGQVAKLTLDTGAVMVANGNDLNDMVEGGFYYGYSLKNAPNIAGYIVVMKRSSTYATQLFFDNNVSTSNNMFRRSLNDGVWQDWIKVLDSDDILDDLTSTSTSSALSAHQGKVLNDKVVELETKSSKLDNIGQSGVTTSNNGTAFGHGTIASGESSHAEGQSTIASGESSHAEGYKTRALGNYSHASGRDTATISSSSMATGYATLAGYGEVYKISSIDNVNKTIKISSPFPSSINVSISTTLYVVGSHFSNTGNSVEVTYVSYDSATGTITYSGSIPIDSTTVFDRFFIRTSVNPNPSFAKGVATIASGLVSSAEGRLTIASGSYSHTEGNNTIASGNYSHAEGSSTTASGTMSHAEGSGTVASGTYSHAEGGISTASGNFSHAEGNSTTASSSSSHAEGNSTTASGNSSHAEGWSTRSEGISSHSEGTNTVAKGDYSHAEGFNTVAIGNSSHVEGNNNLAGSDYSHVEGQYNLATNGTYYKVTLVDSANKKLTLDSTSGLAVGNLIDIKIPNYSPINDASIMAISGNIITVNTSESLTGATSVIKRKDSASPIHVEGSNNTASGNYSHAEGLSVVSSGSASHAEGQSTTASGNTSHAEGNATIASGSSAHAEGLYTVASGTLSHAGGGYTTASVYCSTAIGRFNKAMTGSATGMTSTDDAFVIGSGTGDTAKANAFRVTFNGKVYGLSAFNSTGADYAEYFEWIDENIDNEDRVGYFVSIDGEKIRKSNSTDKYVLGIVSVNPSVVGDSWQDDWNEKYVTDEWGRIQYHYVDVLAEVELIPTDNIDDEGNIVYEEVEIFPARQDYIPILNPNWNPDEEYIPRENRKEWSPIGMMGKLLVRDDGTCEVNKFCKPNDDGIATLSDEDFGFRVMKRVSENIVQVLIK